MIQFCKKEAVLSIAVVLALLSVFFVRPDAGYLAYIDFRTLGILFCLMTIVAGLQQIGVFDRMAKGLLARVAGVGGKNSQRAMDMHMKCQYINEITKEHGVTYLTGTR